MLSDFIQAYSYSIVGREIKGMHMTHRFCKCQKQINKPSRTSQFPFLLFCSVSYTFFVWQDRRCWSTAAPHGTRTVLCVTAVRSRLVQRPSFQTITTTTVCRATRAGLLLSVASAKRWTGHIRSRSIMIINNVPNTILMQGCSYQFFSLLINLLRTFQMNHLAGK